MATLRSRRLELLLGSTTAEATFGQINGLADTGVEEAADLDFKRQQYSPSDRGKKDRMKEDDQARAIGASNMPISDGEANRMLQIIAGIGPLPTVDVRLAEDPDKPGTGFIIVSVPRSAAGPHAVLVNDSLRYPRRHGRTTVYLREPEVAPAYRERFAGLRSKLDAAADHGPRRGSCAGPIRRCSGRVLPRRVRPSRGAAATASDP